MKKVKWLERSLFYGYFLTLVTSQQEFEDAVKGLKLENDGTLYVSPGANATTHSWYPVRGSGACIVGLDLESTRNQDPIDVAALLVHEAVHVWQNNESSAGTLGCFGNEGEAYAIQNISAQLMKAYKEKIK